ncbi:FUSC family protein [Brevibacterium rongguiense]|nr:FUSC family protein [Brevibacterium rongguiense]
MADTDAAGSTAAGAASGPGRSAGRAPRPTAGPAPASASEAPARKRPHPLTRAGRMVLNRARVGGRRIRANMSQLLQVTIGATLAYTFCKLVLGHSYPFLAAVAAAVGTGVVADRRLRRALEIGLGATLGVLVGEFFFQIFGPGIWQIAVVMFIGLVIGTMVNSGGIFITQIAIQSIYVITVPVQVGAHPFDRTVDALVGALVAILMALLVPNDARKVPRDRAANLLQEIAELLHASGRALRTSDQELAKRTLERARDTQDMIDSWRSSLRISEEAARINARSRRYAAEVTRLARACEYADRAMRLVRVICRRIVDITRIGRNRPAVGAMLAGLGDGADRLRWALRRGESRTPAEEELRAVAATLSPQNPDLVDLQDETLVLLLRPLANDLLGACGLTEDAASAYLPELVPGGHNPKAAASGHTVVRTRTETMPLVRVGEAEATGPGTGAEATGTGGAAEAPGLGDAGAREGGSPAVGARASDGAGPSEGAASDGAGRSDDAGRSDGAGPSAHTGPPSESGPSRS